MQRFRDVVLNLEGQPVAGVDVTVKIAGTSTLATLYSDNVGTVLGNPVTTTFAGEFSFYTVNGRYDLHLTKTGMNPIVVSDVLIEDLQSPDSGVLDVDILGNAATATVAAQANTIADGAVSSAAKIAGNIITLSHLNASAFGTFGAGKLLQLSPTGAINPELEGAVPDTYIGSIGDTIEITGTENPKYSWVHKAKFHRNNVPSTYWLHTSVRASNSVFAACLANYVHLSPLWLCKDYYISALGFVLITGQVGKTCKLAIYSDYDGAPFDLLFETPTTSVNIATGADCVATFAAPAYLRAGKYWLAVLTDATTLSIETVQAPDLDHVIAAPLNRSAIYTGYENNAGSYVFPIQLTVGSCLPTTRGFVLAAKVS